MKPRWPPVLVSAQSYWPKNRGYKQSSLMLSSPWTSLFTCETQSKVTSIQRPGHRAHNWKWPVTIAQPIYRLTKCELAVTNEYYPKVQSWILADRNFRTTRQIHSLEPVTYRWQTATAWHEFPRQMTSRPERHQAKQQWNQLEMK